jgi:hypothetical protein
MKRIYIVQLQSEPGKFLLIPFNLYLSLIIVLFPDVFEPDVYVLVRVVTDIPHSTVIEPNFSLSLTVLCLGNIEYSYIRCT